MEQRKEKKVSDMSRRRGGCGSFILGFLVGFLSLILLVVGGGVFAYYKLNIKTVESWIKTEVCLL